MNENTQNRVLLIEDDREIAEVITLNIRDMGLQVEVSSNGPEGLEKALSGIYAIIILDVMLPGMDGMSICRKIREKDPGVPILMLTARAEEIDRVLGLELGADDYMTKPFSVREFTARVKALLRRTGSGLEKSLEDNVYEINIGNLTVDFKKRKVTLNKASLDLTVKEFELLGLFMRNPGKAYSRNELLNLVWGYSFEGYEHTVNTHINRLRNKIETDPAHPVYLKTVWGIGYRFIEETELPE